MLDEQTVVSALLHWSQAIGTANSWRPLHHKHSVLAVTTNQGQFVLKQVVQTPDEERLMSEYRVLQHLKLEGVPVAVPLLADNGQPFVADQGQIYTVAPMLPMSNDISSSPERLYANLGSAIGRLHKALATYPDAIPSWTMDL